MTFLSVSVSAKIMFSKKLTFESNSELNFESFQKKISKIRPEMAEISKFILGLLLVVISSVRGGHCQSMD